MLPVTKCEGRPASVFLSRSNRGQVTMAARKQSSRSTKRTTGRSSGRSTGRKSGSGSSAPILALGAILGLGAFSLWATAQHKSPQAALTALFQRAAPQVTSSAPAKVEDKQRVEKAAVEKKTPSKDYAGAVGPVPRPAALVAPAQNKPVQQAAIQATKSPMPTQKVAPPPPPLHLHAHCRCRRAARIRPLILLP